MNLSSQCVLLVDPEPFYMPHLAARLAAAGRIRSIVVRHQNFPGVRGAARSVQKLLNAWGIRALLGFAVARLLTIVSDKLFTHRYYSIEKVARNFGVPIRFVSKVHSEEFYEHLGTQPDTVVFTQVSVRLRPELLRQAVFLNKHCSLLPKYAGVYPVFWALLNKETRLGVTIHLMNAEYDAGEILAQDSVASEGHSVSSAYHAVHDRAGDLLLGLFSNAACSVQPVGERTYFGWPSSTDRKRFVRQGGRFGWPFRLHPPVQ